MPLAALLPAAVVVARSVAGQVARDAAIVVGVEEAAASE